MGAYLVDTHIFLWFMLGDIKSLGHDLFKLLASPKNRVFLSIASVWEIIIKEQLGKLKVPSNLKEEIRLSGFSLLNIEAQHVFELANLPDYHKDPFDRILVSQARIEGLPLITFDSKIKKYDVQTIDN